jgi:hypothetical protein
LRRKFGWTCQAPGVTLEVVDVSVQQQQPVGDWEKYQALTIRDVVDNVFSCG